MRRQRQETLKRILFRYYSWLIFGLLVILYAITLIYYVNEQIGQVKRIQGNLCTSIGNSVDASIEKMSIVSMNILYSQTIRRELKQAASSQANVKQMEAVYDTIASIIGPYGTVSQVDVHSAGNLAVGWGNYELCREETYTQIPWYQEIKERDGAKFIGIPVFRSDLAYYNRYLRDKKFISLYRMFFDASYKEEGIVEVIQECGKFFGGLNEMREDNPERMIYVLNEDGAQIYPYEEEEQILPQEVRDNFPETEGQIRHLFGVEGRFVSCMRMENCGWMVVVAQDQYQTFRSLILVLAAYLLIGILFIGVSLAVCYKISNAVTDPLNRLKRNMERVDLSDLVHQKREFEPVNARAVELEMLSKGFQEMYGELGLSAQKLLLAKEEELRAKMIATQSMINPHFVFNNLANISVMAEENMNEEIVVLCKNLCDYLRYIAADSMTTVDVATEIFYTRKYLECIKVRYGKRLEWEFDIPKELEAVPISKLSLQPVVENAQKYAFRNKPPWKIVISGAVTESRWELSVSDNGVGIQKEYLQEIYANFERIRLTKDISSMRIGGMGLANVYLRLILLHGDDTKLEIRNRAEGGVIVTMGGRLHQTEEDVKK